MKRPDYLNSEKSEPVAQSIPAESYRQGGYAVPVDSQKVLRNTYALLSMTLVFSGVIAALSMMFNAPHPGLIITLVGFYGLLFAVEKTKNSGMGLVLTFALTGFMGYTLGPILSAYAQLPNGASLIATAMGGTGLIFLAMSGWVLSTGKDLSSWGKMLFAGLITVVVMIVANFFLQLTSMSLAISGVMIVLMSAMIAYQTSAIVHGGESNYISAAVSLYVSIYNLFLSLLQILGIFGSDD
ncbi:Bax inhibitor-1/YccA family protein [uncultured Thalassolituus sp.]|mgnify:CR=1 FL=1|uniref:Bax inhibitor-1/YccA family protein n=1 Tax=uncultured Thalassolituus sp. TaxID=285273 RepID=UPI00262CD509|nr:Bax inhibitor-1/YccA family protein [uncultured Thalassolituus sp.]